MSDPSPDRPRTDDEREGDDESGGGGGGGAETRSDDGSGATPPTTDSDDPSAPDGEDPTTGEPATDDTAVAEPGRAELLTELGILAEQNERLRASSVRARQAAYTRTAIGFAAVGILAAAGAVLFPATATVLFALAGVGLFGALLITFLTPENFVATDVGREVYTALATNEEAIVTELALADVSVYVPPSRADGVDRLFVPEREDWTLPEPDALASLFVVADRDDPRGVALEPTGAPLVRDFEDVVAGESSETPGVLATQLADALVEQFEIVDGARPDADPDGRRLTVAVTGSAYGPVDRLDQPVASFVAVGTARALDALVELEVEPAEGRADYLVTCRWGDESAEGDEADGSPSGDAEPSTSGLT
jgi:hypothetical protein